jgi:hypothetical protein
LVFSSQYRGKVHVVFSGLPRRQSINFLSVLTRQT